MMLLITPNAKKAARIEKACPPEQQVYRIEAPEPQTSDVFAIIREHDVDVVVVGPGLDNDDAADLTADITAEFPQIGVVMFVDEDVDSMRAALRAGAGDVVLPGTSQVDMQTIIDGVRERIDRRNVPEPAPAPASEPGQRVLTVLSPRGGVGRTLVAASLAAELERRHPGDVVLVDLDLQCGDVAAVVGLNPHLTLASLGGQTEEIQPADVKALLAQDSEGLHILAAPQSLTSAVKVTPDLARTTLQMLAEAFQYVVIDTSPYLCEVTLAALDETTDIVLVAAPDVPSVRALARATDALDELEITGVRRHLVVNKATARYGMPQRDIESVSGMSTIAQVPASKNVAMGLNRGTPLHEVVPGKGVIPRAFKDLIELIEPQHAENHAKRGLLGWLS